MKITIDETNSTIQIINDVNIIKILNIPLDIKTLVIIDIINIKNNSLYELQKYSNLELLKIKSKIFNQIIYRTYIKLKYLHIYSEIYDQELDNLPNLIVLNIKSKNFNQSVSNLPHTLKKLKIYSDSFNRELELLPESLTQLYIKSIIFNKQIDDLPIKLKILQLLTENSNNCLENLPNKLSKIIVNNNENIMINNIP